MIGIGFGTWSWGNQLLWGYKPGKEDHVLEKTFRKAVEGGLSFIDTADSYGTGFLNGRSETLIGKFIENLGSENIQEINIATKLAPYPWRIGNKGFQKAFFASRGRLKGNLTRVQLHWSTAKYAPWQELPLIDNLANLVEEGYAKEIGVSNIGPKRLLDIYERLKARGIPLKSLQVQFSLLSPQLGSANLINLQQLCEELNIDFIAYSPLALGILTLAPNNNNLPDNFLRRRLFRKILPASKKLRELLKNIAYEHKSSQAQVALNWCRSHGAMPIVGIRNSTQATDAIKALSWELNSQEKKQLDLAKKDCQARMPGNPFISE